MIEPTGDRDLASEELWMRSLERSRHRREGTGKGVRLKRPNLRSRLQDSEERWIRSPEPSRHRREGIDRNRRLQEPELRTGHGLAPRRVGLRLSTTLEEWGAALARVPVQTHHAVLAGALACYAAAWLATASVKPLWNDELFTLHIADESIPDGLWNALQSGIEQTPPAFYVLMRGSMEVLGTSPVAMRVPAMLGVAATMLCLYLFVARRLGASAGMVAFLTLLTTYAYRYSYEARAYALVLALTAAALLCWQSYTMGKRPQLALVGLALAGAAAVSNHYYALLALLPIALGEAVRAFRADHLDFRVWLALAAALVPLIGFLPLIVSSMDFATVFWAVPYGTSLAEFYPWLLPKATMLFVALLGLSAAAAAVVRARRPPVMTTPPRDRLPAHELAAGVGFLILPVVGYAIAELLTGAFTGRYALAAALGFSIMVPVAIGYIFRGRKIAAFATVGIVAALVLPVMAGEYHVATFWRDAENEWLRLVNAQGLADTDEVAGLQLEDGRAGAGSPNRGDGRSDVVVAEPGAFTQLAAVASPRVRDSLVYLADPERALELNGTDSVDRSLVGLAPFADLDVQSFDSYLAEHERFTVLTRRKPSWAGWLPAALASSGRVAEVRATEGEHYLLDVKPAPPPLER